MPPSAGILLFRRTSDGPEVLLVHPGGPFWQSRRDGWWQLPKGGIGPGEDPLAAARREFREELGADCIGPAFPLGQLRQRGGKQVIAFAVEGDLDPAQVTSIAFEMEWPPRSGRRQSFPEVDEARWFLFAAARATMLPSQQPFLERLAELIDEAPEP